MDTSAHATLTLDEWPWPLNSPAAGEAAHLIEQERVVAPLPAYEFESGDLVIPADYESKLRGALVALHFSLSWNYFRNDDRDTFNAIVRRIDVIDTLPARSNIVRVLSACHTLRY